MLLLLGGRDIPTAVPTFEVSYDQNNKVMQNLNYQTQLIFYFSACVYVLLPYS